MGDLLLGVDCFGEWVEEEKCWHWKSQSKETIPIVVSGTVTFDELVGEVIASCGLSCDRNDISITYMIPIALQNEKVAPSTIKNDKDLRVYMVGGTNSSRPILRVCVKDKSEEVSKPAEQLHSTNIDLTLNNEGNDFHAEYDIGNDCMAGVESVREDLAIENEDMPLEDLIVEEENVHADNLVASNSAMMGTDGTQSSHVYSDESGFYKGQSFKNKAELKRKLKLAAVKKPFEFKIRKSCKTLYVVSCVDPNCKWWIRCMKYVNSDRFYISKYTPDHSCGVQHLGSHHRNASADVIGEFIKNKFVDGKGPSTKEIMSSVRTDLGCKVSYWKCWKGREIAKDLIRGTPEHGYGVLEAYRHMIESTNEESKTALKLDEKGRFKYFFVSYGACIKGFCEMRKVVAVDGCHLTGKYEGVMLSAIAQDTENHTYPIAFCVVDSENDKSWIWFFEQLKGIVPNNEEVCIISDRHPSIAKAISIVYNQVHHGFCMRHLGENLRIKYSCGDYLHVYYSAAKAYKFDEFNDHFQQLHDKDWKLAKYLKEDVRFEKWSRAHFPGNRYDVMTTNIAESVNAMFVMEREFPIVALFDAINKRWAEIFYKRHNEMVGVITPFVPSAENKIRDRMSIGDTLFAYRLSTHEFTVRGLGPDAMVNLQTKSCSCKEFDVDKIPCPHGMAALRLTYGRDFGNSIYAFSSPYYGTQQYINAYKNAIYPVPPEEVWMVPPELTGIIIPPPYVKRVPGRRRVKRIPSIGEVVRKKKNKCSICKKMGHKRTTCPTRRQQEE